jgi:mannosyltransferase
MSAAARRSVKPATVLLLVGLMVVALLLRLPSFHDALFADELGTNFVVHGFGVGDVISIVNGDQEGTPPLFFLLVWLFNGIHGPEGLRMVSLLAGLAAIPLTYLLGVRTVGVRAAAVGAVVVALSPYQIYYATEARAYALTMVLVLVAALTLLAAIDSGRTRWWVAFGLSVAAAAYTHYTSFYVLAGLFAWAFLAHPKARRPLLLSYLGAAVLYIPWVPQFLADRNEPAAKLIDAVHPFSFWQARIDLGEWSFGHPGIPVHDLPGQLGIWLIAAALLLGAIGLLLRVLADRSDSRWRPPTRLVLVLVLALATPVGLILQSIVSPSVFIPRNLISSSPALALLIGTLVTAPRQPVRLIAAASLIAGFAIGGVKMLDADNRRPDYDGAADFIERTGGPTAPVADLAALSPGLQTALEAALAPSGEPLPPDRAVLEIGYTSFATRLEAARHFHVFTSGQPPSPEQLARQAAADAGDGKLFLVTLGTDASLAQLRAAGGVVGPFLAALPAGFHEVEYRSFPGFNDVGVEVHVLERSPGA